MNRVISYILYLALAQLVSLVQLVGKLACFLWHNWLAN